MIGVGSRFHIDISGRLNYIQVCRDIKLTLYYEIHVIELQSRDYDHDHQVSAGGDEGGIIERLVRRIHGYVEDNRKTSSEYCMCRGEVNEQFGAEVRKSLPPDLKSQFGKMEFTVLLGDTLADLFPARRHLTSASNTSTVVRRTWRSAVRLAIFSDSPGLLYQSEQCAYNIIHHCPEFCSYEKTFKR
ncbi:hypothetical protein J6590_032087 [Homalodisca vitripennis]|nr:hypothetical protein J6590_032087 [Homalodisca vitripennis]